MTEWLNSYQEEQWISDFTPQEWIDTLPEYVWAIHHNLVLLHNYYYTLLNHDTHNVRTDNDFLNLTIKGGV